MARPTPAKPQHRRTGRRQPGIEGDPDFLNPKGFILTRSFPEHYGHTLRQQLRKRLELAGFTDIKLTKTVGDDTGWAVKMDRGSSTESSNSEELIHCLMRFAKDIGRRIERAGIAAVVSGQKIEASFVLLPPSDVLP